jgi:hypothetical protein
LAAQQIVAPARRALLAGVRRQLDDPVEGRRGGVEGGATEQDPVDPVLSRCIERTLAAQAITVHHSFVYDAS